jgi:hypothetical protein
MKASIITALAVALALPAPALAQDQSPTPENQAAASDEQGGKQGTNSYNLLTIQKLTQDLKNAGFTDIRVISDSFVVQAKDKDGNPTVMTLSPSGVFAISEISKGGKEAKASPGAQQKMQHE